MKSVCGQGEKQGPCWKNGQETLEGWKIMKPSMRQLPMCSLANLETGDAQDLQGQACY